VPTVVLYETRLVLGLRGARRKLAKAERVLARMPRAPLDDPSAARAADVGVHLSARGAGIGPIDTLVAGTALAHGEPLLCSDPDFDRVPGLTVIRYR